MNVFTGKPSYRLIAPEDAPPLTPIWPTDTIFIKLAIANPHLPYGEVIASEIPLHPLKEVAPVLLKYLTIDGHRIVFPRSHAIDEPLLVNLVNLLTDQYSAGIALSIDLTALPQDPVKLIKLHVLFDLFGLRHLAQDLSENLWTLCGACTLTLEDVLWIWAALGPHKDALWSPSASDEYMQLMAWNVLNADQEGTLVEELRELFERKKKDLKPLLALFEKRFREYGLQRQQQPVGRRDSTQGSEVVNERIDSAHVPFYARPPTRSWARPVVVPSLHPGCSYDECGAVRNKVKAMAAQRDELVRLRRL